MFSAAGYCLTCVTQIKNFQTKFLIGSLDALFQAPLILEKKKRNFFDHLRCLYYNKLLFLLQEFKFFMRNVENWSNIL